MRPAVLRGPFPHHGPGVGAVSVEIPACSEVRVSDTDSAAAETVLQLRPAIPGGEPGSDAHSIVTYYRAAELDYRLVWRLGSQMAMHFGYWDSSTRTLAAALQRENQILADWASIRGSDSVLDAGCGVGGSAIYLGRNIGCRVLGITLSESQVRTAERNAARSQVAELVHFKLRDFVATGLPDASFDVVWAIESVCHAETKLDFLQEAYRILRPGGRLIVADGFAIKDELSPDEAALMRSWLDGWAVPSIDTVQQFRSSMRAAGFPLPGNRMRPKTCCPPRGACFAWHICASWSTCSTPCAYAARPRTATSLLPETSILPSDKGCAATTSSSGSSLR